MRLVAITAALLMAISAGMMILPTREGMETGLSLPSRASKEQAQSLSAEIAEHFQSRVH